MKKSLFFAVLGAGLLVIGCQGGSSSDSNSSNPQASNNPPSSAATSTTGSTPGGTTTAAGTTGGSAGSGYTAVASIFSGSCMPCHNSSNHKAGLDLTTYDSAMKGTKEGPIVKAGDSKNSDLLKYLSGEKKPQMPQGRPPLSADQIKTITDWIDAGAKNG